MRVISCSVKNFASYKELNFDFTNQGLTLLHGATGSGKSTLCDIIPWCLFGITSKGGTVTDVLTWPGDEVTEGTIILDNLMITRKRGSKAKDNDLYYCQDVSDTVQYYRRGKDLQDTQKLINGLIGMDADLYLAGAYLHEFSQTAQFFTTTAKNRRLICEQLVDLTLAKTLQTKLSENKKTLYKALEQSTKQADLIDERIRTYVRVQVSAKHRSETWLRDQKARMNNYVKLYDQWEIDYIQRVQSAGTLQSDNKCPACGSTVKHKHLKPLVQAEINPYLSRIADLEQEVNPYTEDLKDYSKEVSDAKVERVSHDVEHNKLALKFQDIELLQEVVDAYRSTSIKNTIHDIENLTNQLLTKYFDGEIRVNFEVEDADKLEVTILKDGNQASFTQLSKGQRCLLKLCFGVSVMKAVQNHHGIKLEQLFFDEALDGLSETLKIKAFSLFEELSTEAESVYVVEHSGAFKSMFTNQIEVELVNGESVLNGQT